ncbi:MAG: TIGR03016 family PEP-CTERM system-associated outer membrane protein, partial [Aquincola sp.]|nr:TIGR03016 family PEP-CTERM system-associated outer membrane protein [Aquincola sp.]
MRLTGTDNYRLLPVKESDTVTEAGAGLRIVGTRGKVRGFLDYALTGTAYSRHSDENDVRHSLAAFGTAELVDGFAFVDAQASYTRQALSAFGVQTALTRLDADNQTDTASISVSPRLRGRFAPTVRYEGRATVTSTRAKDTSDGDVDAAGVQLLIDGGVEGTALGWRAQARHDVSDYRAGRRTFDSRLLAGVSYVVSYELKVGATAGAERTDLRVQNGDTTNTAGLEAEWRPTERTLVAANVEKRFFGTGHSLQLSHRTASTVWTLADARDVSTAGTTGATAFGTNYDLAFNSTEFAAEKDLVQRDIKVRDALRKENLDPSAVPVQGFLAAAATL